MARNIEIKARSRDLPEQVRLAAAISDRGPEVLIQEDTFFNVPRGRLKRREFGDGSGVLVQYEREDSERPKESHYVLSATREPASVKEALANALGVRSTVRKRRTLYLVGQTRIHLDEVEGLGSFVELEVVLRPGEDLAYGTAIAEDLMSRLRIEENDLIGEAYVDLLEDRLRRSPIMDEGNGEAEF
jgi:predicted adenylyl cyclase CyaB